MCKLISFFCVTHIDRMAKSATEEMATEIARLAQTRIVEVGIQFECAPVTLKMVKTTLGVGWLLNSKLLFSDVNKAAKAFCDNIRISATRDDNDYNYSISLGGIIVFRYHPADKESNRLVTIAALLKDPPLVVNEDN